MTKKLRFMVFERDGFTCRYCGSIPPKAKLQVDHIIPSSKGGSYRDLDNLVTSCSECNAGKKDCDVTQHIVARVGPGSVDPPRPPRKKRKPVHRKPSSSLADRVRKARGNLSRNELSMLMRKEGGMVVPVSWIRDIETGMVLNPRFDRMATLAHVLGVSLSELEGS